MSSLFAIYKLKPLYPDHRFHSYYFYDDGDEYYYQGRVGTKDFEWSCIACFAKYKELIHYCFMRPEILANLSVDMRETSVRYNESILDYQLLYYILKFTDNVCYEVDINQIKHNVAKYKKPKYRKAKFKWLLFRSDGYILRRSSVPGIHKRNHHRKSARHNSYIQLKTANTDPDYKEFSSSRSIYHSRTVKWRLPNRCWKSQYKCRKQYMIHL